jgi:hypothetical protein
MMKQNNKVGSKMANQHLSMGEGLANGEKIGEVFIQGYSRDSMA